LSERVSNALIGIKRRKAKHGGKLGGDKFYKKAPILRSARARL
jgi:hypothetical protein